MKPVISYNELYLSKDGTPWFPVMGEMHFTRYREDLWEESLRKMKAGGLTIVSAYAIWIHHEEEEGVFDFSGCRNIRKFVEACEKVGIKLFLRLGPWVHGEVRNGGFPDWVNNLSKEGVDLRSNDERYLKLVRRYWEQVYNQIGDFFKKATNPIIGIQIENEYGHVGGYTGEKGESHMRRLMELSKEIGFDAPMYTATGWGGAVIGDCLPVMGGYCEAPWNQGITELSPNTNYIISHVRNDALIASDHHVEGAVTFDESKFPYLTAELGGGLQVTEHRRPVATGKDIGAMSLTKLASGVALLGYYMYHGGSNPEGKLSTLQESKATGYANNLPEINYDFNAPIRQYGTISDSLKEIKLLSMFLNDFGSDIATLPADIFPDNVKPSDMHTLRTSVRHDDKHGYVFFNNYQRRHVMDAHEKVVFKGICDGEDVLFPAIDIESGEYGFFPYNMKLGEKTLVSALSTPLCTLNDEFVFYGDREPQYVFEGEAADIISISREDALNAWKVSLDKEYLVINEDFVWADAGKLFVSGNEKTVIKVYPEFTNAPDGFKKTGVDGAFSIYERKVAVPKVIVSAGKIDVSEGTCKDCSNESDSVSYEIDINYSDEIKDFSRQSGKDVVLWLEYEGFKVDIYSEGKKINDHFYTGQKLPISLGYHDYPKKLNVKITPLYEDTWVYLEKWPQLSDEGINGKKCAARLCDVKVEATVM